MASETGSIRTQVIFPHNCDVRVIEHPVGTTVRFSLAGGLVVEMAKPRSRPCCGYEAGPQLGPVSTTGYPIRPGTVPTCRPT